MIHDWPTTGLIGAHHGLYPESFEARVTAGSVDDRSRVVLRRSPATTSANPYLDGGWWPRSLDLLTELPALLTALSDTGFNTVRLVYRLHAWKELPRRTTIEGRRIDLSGYRKQAADTVALIDRSEEKRLELLVIPPDTEPDVARRALDIAGRDGDPDPAEEVLNRAHAATVSS